MAKAKEESATVVEEKKKTEVAKVESTAVAKVAVDFEADEGAGMGNMSAKDMLIPYYAIIQANSKVLKKTEPNYIKGAEQGMFVNTATGKTYDGEKGVVMIFCDFFTRFTEWTPVDQGGGFVAAHGDNEDILKSTTKDEKGRDMTARGTQIVKSADYPAIIYNEETGEIERVLVSMTSTQLKKARRLNTYANNLQLPRKDGKGMYSPPLYYMSYKVTTVPEKNSSGDWHGFRIEPYKPLPDLIPDEEDLAEVYAAVKHFAALIRSGEAKVDQTQGVPDSEIPF